MVFSTDGWAVAGGQTSAQGSRLMMQSMSRTRHGVVEPWHMRVKQMENASSDVRVTYGAYYALGQEENFQGTYYDYNVGDTVVSIAGNTDGVDRYDLVYVRVEDNALPQWSHDPKLDPISYIVIAPNVSSATTEIPAGETGEPLGLVRVPANTADPAITNANITDLRRQADPLSDTFDDTKRHEAAVGSVESLSSQGSFIQFPSSASFAVDVPEWAVRMNIILTVHNLQFRNTTNQPQENNFFGNAQFTIDGDVPGSNFGEWNVDWYGTNTRSYIIASGTSNALPYAGSQVLINMETLIQGGGEVIRADNGVMSIIEVFFRQEAYYNDP